MIKIYLSLTENGQELLLSISYNCYTSEGIASYNGVVECSAESLVPYNSSINASCMFSFCRDAYWNALCNPSIVDLQGIGTSILRDALQTVARAIMEYEEQGN